MAFALLAAVPAMAKPIEIAYWAVQATQENHGAKQYGPGLEAIRSSLADLPHDTFTLLHGGELSAELNGRADTDLAPKYRLRVEPLAEEGPDRLRLHVVVEFEKTPEQWVKALDTRVVLSKDKKMRLGGMKLEKGDLVLVISAK